MRHTSSSSLGRAAVRRWSAILLALSVTASSLPAFAADGTPSAPAGASPLHKQGLWGEGGLLAMSTFTKFVRPGAGLFVRGGYRWDRWSLVAAARGAIGPTRYGAVELGAEANILRRGFTPWVGVGFGWSWTRFEQGPDSTYGNAGLTASGAVGITTGTAYPVRIALRVNLPFYAESQHSLATNSAAPLRTAGVAPTSFLLGRTHHLLGSDYYPRYAPTFGLDVGYAF